MPSTALGRRDCPSSQLLLNLANKRVIRHARGTTIYSQGDRADSLFFNVEGTILLTIVSQSGKEGVIEIIAGGELFGESCILEQQQFRTSSAMALEPTTLVWLDKMETRSLLRRSADCAEEFMGHLMQRNHKIQEHLADQLFHPSELRLARVLRDLSQSGDRDLEQAKLPRISQSTLAAMVGTTRSRVSYFLMKFRRMGVIDSRKGLRVNTQRIDALLKEQESLL
jgi:CRP/FNR family transcriptional regulator, cyclic AMP receptor protein